MDKEKEINSLKEKLGSIDSAIRGELSKIETLKTKLSKGYRRHDKENYEAERRAIMENLKKHEAEMVVIRKKLSELEAR